MPETAYDAYLESRIESATPVQLVRLLYQGALNAVRQARRLLGSGDIAARSRAVSKAFDILTELSTSLDRGQGAEIASRLAQLYDYMQRRLVEANTRQEDAPLAEVLGLLTTLADAWQEIADPAQPMQPEPGPWQMAGAEKGEMAAHAWSA